MKVKELISKLSKFDPELEVFKQGYEGGYNRVEILEDEEEIHDFVLNQHTEWYYGPHERLEYVDQDDLKSDRVIEKGIIL